MIVVNIRASPGRLYSQFEKRWLKLIQVRNVDLFYIIGSQWHELFKTDVVNAKPLRKKLVGEYNTLNWIEQSFF